MTRYLALSDPHHPRHVAPLPPERALSVPFLFDPARRLLVCPFPFRRTGLSWIEQEALARVQDRITGMVELPAVPVWCWAGRDELVPIRKVEPGWLAAWVRGRAAFRFLPGA